MSKNTNMYTNVKDNNMPTTTYYYYAPEKQNKHVIDMIEIKPTWKNRFVKFFSRRSFVCVKINKEFTNPKIFNEKFSLKDVKKMNLKPTIKYSYKTYSAIQRALPTDPNKNIVYYSRHGLGLKVIPTANYVVSEQQNSCFAAKPFLSKFDSNTEALVNRQMLIKLARPGQIVTDFETRRSILFGEAKIVGELVKSSIIKNRGNNEAVRNYAKTAGRNAASNYFHDRFQVLEKNSERLQTHVITASTRVIIEKLMIDPNYKKAILKIFGRDTFYKP